LKTSEKPLDLLSQELKELTEGIQEFQEKTFESLYSKKVLWSLDRSKSNSGDDSIRSDVVASAIEETGATSTPTEESVPVPAVAPVAEPVSEPASTPVLITDVSSVKKIDPPAVATKTAPSKEIISEAAVSATSTNVLTAGSAGGMESDVSVLLKDVPVDTTKSVDPNVEKLQILKAQQTISKSFLSLLEEEKESTVTEARVAPAAARISSSSSVKQPSNALDSIFDIFKSDATAKKDAPKDSNVVSKITTASTVTQQPLVEVPPTPTVVVPPPVVIKKPTVAPSPAIQSPLLSGLFGFLSPSPGFQGSATPTKKTTAAPPKPSLSVPEVEDSPTILPPQEEAFAKKSVELVAPPPRAAAVKSADSSTAATKSKGLFGFLGDSSEDFFEDDPTSTSRTGKRLLVSAVADADEERVVAPPTAVKTVETKSTSGGLFGFLSPPSTAPAKKLSVVSEVEKDGRAADAVAAPVVVEKVKVVAPPAVKQASLKVPVKAVVKDVNKAAKPAVEEMKEEAKPESSIVAKTSSVGGGFFGFLNQAPAAPVKKSVAPAVVSKVAPPVVKPVTTIAKKELVAEPTIKKEAKTSSSGGGGLFGFLNPSPAAIKKPVVVVPDVEAKPEAPALSATRKLSNPLNAKPAAPKSVTISPVAKIVLPPVVKQVAPKVIVKDVSKAAKPAVVEVKEEAKPESSVVAKTSSVGGGFFGFLNQAPAAPVKKSEAAQINTSPIAAVRPAPPTVSKPVAPPQQQQRRPQEKAKPLNLFGFLDSSENFFEDQPSSLPPASNVKGPVSPLPPKVESPVVAKTSSVGGGFFGFLNQAPAAPVKKSVAPAVVSKVAPPVVKQPVTPIAKKELVAEPIIKKEAKTSSSGGGGLFGFLNPSPAAIKKPVVVVPEATAPIIKKEVKTSSSGGGGLFGFLNPSPAAIKKPVVVVPEVKAPGSPPAVEAKKTNPLNARPAASKVVLPPPVTKPTPSSMDKSFQLSVSKLLKGDTKKIMLFQKATDSFRSGGISAADYIVSLEKLFGSDVLGVSIIPPLIAQLPEKDRSSELRKAYEQTRKTGSSSKDKKTTK